MEVGTISITGTIDTSDIERGKTRINNSLSEIRSNTESSFGSFERLKSVTSSVAGSLVKIGSVGLTAMSGLASLSPQVAPAMAKIANEMRNLSFALGDRLSPLFASIGNDLIPAIGTAIERFSPQIDSLVQSGVEGISDISNALKGEWQEIDNIVPKSAGAILGGAAGFSVGGFKGMLLGAALGNVIGDKMVPEVTKEEEEKYGPFAESMTLSEKTGDAISQWGSDLIDLWFGPPEMVASNYQKSLGSTAKMLGLGFQTGFNAISDFFQYLSQNTNDKNMSYSGTGDYS
jgi:hypothetical protein